MKKKIPLEITSSLYPIFLKNEDILVKEPNTSHLFHVKDNDKESDFYFVIIERKTGGTQTEYVFEKHPTTENDLVKQRSISQMAGVIAAFESWIKIIWAFNETPSYYDDPIVRSYEEYYNALFFYQTKMRIRHPLKHAGSFNWQSTWKLLSKRLKRLSLAKPRKRFWP